MQIPAGLSTFAPFSLTAGGYVLSVEARVRSPHGVFDVFISSTQGKEYAMKRDGKRIE